MEPPRVVAFINPRSGGQRGEAVAAALRASLGVSDELVMMKPSEGGPRDGIRRLLERLQTQLDDEAAAGSSQSSSSGSSNGAGSSAGSSGVPRAIVLACGGDGTFNWVCSELFAAAAGESGGGAGVLGLVDVVPLPLGTGNDVGRALGWGGRQPGRADIARLFGGDGGSEL